MIGSKLTSQLPRTSLVHSLYEPRFEDLKVSYSPSVCFRDSLETDNSYMSHQSGRAADFGEDSGIWSKLRAVLLH